MFKLKKNVNFGIYIGLSLLILIFINIKYWIPLENSDYFDILLFLFMMIVINSFPLKVGKGYILFTLIISLTVFFEYGLVVEIWLTQLSVLISLMVSNVKRSPKKIFINQLMFLWISILSGLAFFLVGGKTSFTIDELYSQLIPIFIYIMIHFVVNNIIVFVFRSSAPNNKEVKFLSEDILWSAVALIYTLPFGLIIYIMKITYGPILMVLTFILFFIVIYLFKLYCELYQSHKKIETLSEVNMTFTAELNLEKTISALQEAIRDLLIFEYSNIFIVNSNKIKLISSEDSFGTKFFNESEEQTTYSVDGVFGNLIINKKIQIIDSDANVYLSEIKINYLHDCKSLISLPMIWHGKVTGAIVLISKEEHCFSNKDIKIMEILASQAGVAIRNATTYQLTEERTLIDELTGIYNFRAFSNLLTDVVIESEMEKEKVSLLMIDLDYFKKVNDKYGHEAGNNVLKEIAKLLKLLTRKVDIVSRYGGEEFTVIIPNTDCYGAKAIAERIRETIATHSIVIEDCSNNENIISITASIGVATFPDMALSANELIKFADRALYIGSKQKGRNKVSLYEKEV